MSSFDGQDVLVQAKPTGRRVLSLSMLRMWQQLEAACCLAVSPSTKIAAEAKLRFLQRSSYAWSPISKHFRTSFSFISIKSIKGLSTKFCLTLFLLNATQSMIGMGGYVPFVAGY